MTQASPATDRLFKFNRELVGASIADVVAFLGTRMDEVQLAAFTDEQYGLIGKAASGQHDLHAVVCLAFNDEAEGADAPGNPKYLPVITDTAWDDGDDLVLRVVYIAVTGVARKDSGRVWKAELASVVTQNAAIASAQRAAP